MAKSTKIIAALGVVAGLGVAALPMASYADDVTSITDTIEVVVDASCTFKSTTGENAASDEGKAYTTTESVVNGGEKIFDAHYFNVFCNNSKGYTVKAYAEGLTQDGVTPDTDNKTNYIEYVSNAGYSKTGATGKWTAVVSGGSEGAAIALANGATDTEKLENASAIKSSETSVDGTATADNFNVVYKVYVGTKTDAGTYKGSVVYNLTPNA